MAAGTGPPDPLRVLGAVLPDLTPMAGLGRPRGPLDGAAALGLDCHHATDRAFHRHRAFVAGAADLREGARGAGLGDGAARAVGHAGWELLLDGALPGGPAAQELFAAALARAGELAPAFGPDASTWLALAGRVADGDWWRHYDDPAVVAEGLCRRLARRPRLAFPPDQVPAVAAVLAAARPSVVAAAPGVVAEVTAAVRR